MIDKASFRSTIRTCILLLAHKTSLLTILQAIGQMGSWLEEEVVVDCYLHLHLSALVFLCFISNIIDSSMLCNLLQSLFSCIAVQIFVTCHLHTIVYFCYKWHVKETCHKCCIVLGIRHIVLHIPAHITTAVVKCGKNLFSRYKCTLFCTVL